MLLGCPWKPTHIGHPSFDYSPPPSPRSLLRLLEGFASVFALHCVVQVLVYPKFMLPAVAALCAYLCLSMIALPRGSWPVGTREVLAVLTSLATTVISFTAGMVLSIFVHGGP